jgi:hypothetical protein
MAQIIQSTDIVPPGSVGSVREEPIERARLQHREQMVRLFLSAGFIVILLGLCIYVLVTDNVQVKDYKTGAWGLIGSLGGGLISYFTGVSTSKKKED